MINVLVDNSALRLFALRDPTARATNRLMRLHGVVPLVTAFTIGEMLHGLVEDPSHKEVCDRCAFLLRLNDLWILPTNDECLWYEYSRQIGLTKRSGPFGSVTEMLSLLRLSSEGNLPNDVAEAGRAHYSELPAQFEEAVFHILGGSSIPDFRVVSYEDVASIEDLASVAETIVKKKVAELGFPLDRGLLAGAVMNAGRSNGRAPYLSGEARVHVWCNWWIARHGTISRKFREDLKLLIFAPYAGYVLSEDKDYQKYGPTMFPDVQFIRPSSFLKRT